MDSCRKDTPHQLTGGTQLTWLDPILGPTQNDAGVSRRKRKRRNLSFVQSVGGRESYSLISKPRDRAFSIVAGFDALRALNAIPPFLFTKYRFTPALPYILYSSSNPSSFPSTNRQAAAKVPSPSPGI